MKLTAFIVFFILTWIASAVLHEADLSKNFNKTGDAGSFFFEIKILKDDLNVQY